MAERRTGALVVLLPADSDPITAASSEDMAHMTTVWMGSNDSIDDAAQAAIAGEVRSYAASLDGPVIVPVLRRGELGDDGADVVFLERTDALANLRAGLMESSPHLLAAHDAAEQFPEWTPHVTLGYPEGVENGPAVGEFAGEEVVFDRLGLWLGGDYTEYRMGGVMDDEEMPDDELEDGEEEVVEIPVHGVATIEGRPSGDGRAFKRGALSHRDLPLPLRLEVVGTHGGSTSDVVVVGRIDEMWRVEGDEFNEYRYRGSLILTKEYANQAIEGIVDGSLTGVSIEADAMRVDEEHEAAQALAFEKVLDGGELSSEEKDLLSLTVFSESRVCGFTIVPIPAFQEAYIALGHAFEDELTEEDRVALAACGCSDMKSATIVDLTDLSPEELEHYDSLPPKEQEAWFAEWLAAAFRNYTEEERREMAEDGRALPDGSYPIADEEDLRNAIQAIGRAEDPEAAKAHIKKRARALDKEDLIPEGWSLALAAGGDMVAEIARQVGEFAPGTKDGPGWITHPVPTSRIRRYWTRGKGAAKIRWGTPGDFNRCRRQLAKYVKNPDWLAGTCANMHKEAIGTWPGRHGGRHALVAAGAKAAPLVELTAAARREVPSELFERPILDDPRVGIVVDGDRVYGYVAQWGVCHIGIEGACTTAPTSPSRYAYYATGVVHTEAGPVRVGQITMDTGHASLRANARAAAAHYDNTGSAVADVAIGEDEFGIWFSGSLRPKITEDQIHALEASGRISGDWREIGGSLELVAALVVNVPGFPIPAHAAIAASGGVQTALVAAGIIEAEESNAEVEVEGLPEPDENADWLADMAERVADRLEERRRGREAASAARDRANRKLADDARRRLGEKE